MIRKEEDDDVLRDGQRLRVPLALMDSSLDPVQRAIRDAVKYGSLGPGNMHVEETPDVPPTFGVEPLGARGAHPDEQGTTRELPPKKGPPRTAMVEQAYADYINRLVGAWKNK